MKYFFALFVFSLKRSYSCSLSKICSKNSDFKELIDHTSHVQETTQNFTPNYLKLN